MQSRYSSRAMPRVIDEKYAEYFRSRLGRSISSALSLPLQWPSPEISYPPNEVLATIEVLVHVWKQGDSFYKLSYKYYADSTMWWVIPWFNKKPLLSDYSFGDAVEIPLNLRSVHSYFL